MKREACNVKVITLRAFVLYCTRFALSFDKIGCTSAIQNKSLRPFVLYCTRFALSFDKKHYLDKLGFVKIRNKIATYYFPFLFFGFMFHFCTIAH